MAYIFNRSWLGGEIRVLELKSPCKAYDSIGCRCGAAQNGTEAHGPNWVRSPLALPGEHMKWKLALASLGPGQMTRSSWLLLPSSSGERPRFAAGTRCDSESRGKIRLFALCPKHAVPIPWWPDELVLFVLLKYKMWVSSPWTKGRKGLLYRRPSWVHKAISIL